MQTFYITFRHYHTYENMNMQNFFVKVIAENETIARDIVRVIYGSSIAEFHKEDFTPNSKQELFETIKQRLTI